MKIAVFFTYDYGVETLDSIGILDRELKIYRKIKDIYKCNFVFFTYDEKINNINLDDEFEFIPIYKYINKSNNKLIRFIKSFFIPYKIKNLISDIDILHQHQLLGVWVPIILKKIFKLPLLTRTGYDAFEFSIKNNESWIRRNFYKALTQFTLKFSDLYTVTSLSDLNFLNKYFKTSNIKVVSNWVDEVQVNKNIDRTSKILMVGRLEKQKNYQLVLDFLNYSKLNLEIDIYGSGSEFQYLEKNINENNLNVNLLGNIPHNNLIEKYKYYKYFLSTSVFEGNPKTILEALSQGCIVIATNIPNHSELIENDINGLLYNNIEELKDIFYNKIYEKSIEKKFQINNLGLLKTKSIENIAETMYLDYKFLISDK